MADILRITRSGDNLVLHMSNKKRVLAFPAGQGWLPKTIKPPVDPKPPEPTPDPGDGNAPPPAPGKWQWPFQYSRYVLSDSRAQFGYRIHPVTGIRRLHAGLDFGGGGIGGLAVPCAADGIVTYAGYTNSQGNNVKVDHGNGLETWYYHFVAPPSVTTGQKVTKGQKLGNVGSTGLSTGNHLHWETHTNGEPNDPRAFMKARGVPET